VTIESNLFHWPFFFVVMIVMRASAYSFLRISFDIDDKKQSICTTSYSCSIINIQEAHFCGTRTKKYTKFKLVAQTVN